jgi:hypothetical protein
MTEMESVYCAVRTEYSTIIYVTLRLQSRRAVAQTVSSNVWLFTIICTVEYVIKLVFIWFSSTFFCYLPVGFRRLS